MNLNDTRATLFALLTTVAAIALPLSRTRRHNRQLAKPAHARRTIRCSAFNPSLDDGSIRSLQSRMGTPVRPDLPLYRNSTLTDPKVQTKALGYDDDIEVLLPPGVSIGKTKCSGSGETDERFGLRMAERPGS